MASSWELTQTELIRTVFVRYARDGFVDGDTGRAVLSASGLSWTVLGFVWELADKDEDGRLNESEFVLAFHICVCLRKRKLSLPSLLPEILEKWYSEQQSRRLPRFAKGNRVIHHRQSDGVLRLGTVIGVHADDVVRGFYYTVRLESSDNQELQANEERLSFAEEVEIHKPTISQSVKRPFEEAQGVPNDLEDSFGEFTEGPTNTTVEAPTTMAIVDSDTFAVAAIKESLPQYSNDASHLLHANLPVAPTTIFASEDDGSQTAQRPGQSDEIDGLPSRPSLSAAVETGGNSIKLSPQIASDDCVAPSVIQTISASGPNEQSFTEINNPPDEEMFSSTTSQSSASILGGAEVVFSPPLSVTDGGTQFSTPPTDTDEVSPVFSPPLSTASSLTSPHEDGSLSPSIRPTFTPLANNFASGFSAENVVAHNGGSDESKAVANKPELVQSLSGTLLSHNASEVERVDPVQELTSGGNLFDGTGLENSTKILDSFEGGVENSVSEFGEMLPNGQRSNRMVPVDTSDVYQQYASIANSRDVDNAQGIALGLELAVSDINPKTDSNGVLDSANQPIENECVGYSEESTQPLGRILSNDVPQVMDKPIQPHLVSFTGLETSEIPTRGGNYLDADGSFNLFGGASTFDQQSLRSENDGSFASFAHQGRSLSEPQVPMHEQESIIPAQERIEFSLDDIRALEEPSVHSPLATATNTNGKIMFDFNELKEITTPPDEKKSIRSVMLPRAQSKALDEFDFGFSTAISAPSLSTVANESMNESGEIVLDFEPSDAFQTSLTAINGNNSYSFRAPDDFGVNEQTAQPTFATTLSQPNGLPTSFGDDDFSDFSSAPPPS